MRSIIAALTLVAANLWGCAPTSDIDEQTQPLPIVAKVQTASSCIGSIPETASFAIVADHAELITVIDTDTETHLCADTFDAIEISLGTQSVRAERLWLQYLLSLEEVGQSLGQVLPQQ